MMFDSQDSSPATTAASAFEPLARRTPAKRNLRGKGGALLTSTGMIAAASALTLSGEALAQGVPSGFAPAPADVVSYVQLSNGSVLVQLANQQSLLVTSNNFFIDGGGVLYLSPSVSSGIAGGGAATGPLIGGGTVGLPAPSGPIGTTTIGQTSGGVIFDDTAAAATSGGILGTITGGPGLFGLGTLGTIAAIGLGGGAVLLAANAIRSRLSDDTSTDPTENQTATIVATDDGIEKGETGGTLTYAITDQDGIDESDLVASIEAGLAGASTVASIFPGGADVTTERSGSGLVEGTEDTFRSINVTLTGDVADGLNVGEFAGPAVTFMDAKGNEETVNFALKITDSTDTGGGTGGTGNTSTGTLELDATDGGTYDIPQGGTYDFSGTDTDGDPIEYELTSQTSGFGINQAGQVVVAASVPVGPHTIVVTATSTNSDGTVETDVETYNINVTAGSGGSAPVNTVNADFDSEGAGFNTLTGVKVTDGKMATNSDDQFEVPDASDMANSYVIDGLAGNDTLYFSEFGATYHFDPTLNNTFEDVSGFETLTLMSDVDLELNGGVLDSTETGDIEHIVGSGDNNIKLIKEDADLGLDVSVSNIDMIDMNGQDLTLDQADLSGVNKVMDDTSGMLVFTGEFDYDFAEGLLELESVETIGLDGGNYSYSLTLDGVNDEEVREIVSDGDLVINGDTMIDTRLNDEITKIDLGRGEGSDGNNNIFATYNDPMTIRGGNDTDDVDLTLESDIEAGELIIDLGADDDDTVDFNLNGEDIDMTGDGRILRGVEYVDVDTEDGDGEVTFQFNGSGVDMSDIIDVDLGDLDEEGSVILRGDLSSEAAHDEDLIEGTDFTRSLSNPGASGVYAIEGANASFEYGGSISAAYVGLALMDQSGNLLDADDLDGDATGIEAGSATHSVLVDGFVADEDLSIEFTAGDDVVDLIIGESELALTLDEGAGSLSSNVYAIAVDGGVAQNMGLSALLAGAAVTQGTGAGQYDNTADILVTQVVGAANSDLATASQAVDVFLSGGDDSLSLVLGSTQEELVTVHVAQASTNDEDIITVTALEDLAGTPATIGTEVAGAAEGVVFDFEDDITDLIESTATNVASVNETTSSAGALIVFGGAAVTSTATQAGLLYDADGDGEFSEGDTVIDLTSAIDITSLDLDPAGTEIEFHSTLGDMWNFELASGNLQDIV